MLYKTWPTPTLPPLLIWIGLWVCANLTCHVIGSDAVAWGCWWRREAGQQPQVRPRHQQHKSHARGWKRGLEVEATQQLHHPGELIYFLCVSSMTADFSCNQAITSLQGKGDERMGGCGSCLLGSTWRGLRNTSPSVHLTQLGSTAMLGPVPHWHPQAPTVGFSPAPLAFTDVGSSSICCCCSKQKIS